MYNVTITMVTGKVFKFQTDEESKSNEYQLRYERNQLFCIPVDGGKVYINPMQIAYAEFKKVSE